MKLVKMSLVAAMLTSASAFAIENIKVSGDAKLFYSTQDDSKANTNASLFDINSSTGEASLNLNLTADLTENVSAGTTLNAITTLGLYNNIVSSTWTGGTQDTFFFGEAWLAGTAGKTTGKIGRMQLDTPLVFSETWSVVPNTFEAAVLINQDLPGTTLVGAYVGQHNSAAALGGGFDDFSSSAFKSFYNGAYAIGAVNNSFEPLTAQAWYYDAQQAVKAYWLQADLEMAGFVAGLQYTGADWYASDTTGTAYAAKLGYEMADTFAISAAYSSVDDEASAGANLAGSQSKLYTEAWWYYGIITLADTTAFNVTATVPVAGYDLGIYYTQAAVGADDADFSEATFEVAKAFGSLDVGLYYIYTKYDVDNDGDAYNTLQAYLTYNF
jgi:hypothetical protein